jgi:hypothetical protein
VERTIPDLGLEQCTDAGTRSIHNFDGIGGTGAPKERLHCLHHQHPRVSRLNGTCFAASQTLENCNQLVGKRADIRSFKHISTAKRLLQPFWERRLSNRECLIDGFCFVIPVQNPEAIYEKERALH